MTWHLARRTALMNPSSIREILKVTERPGIISLAGGLPCAEAFPVEAVREASARVLRDTAHASLQYASSEGLPELREWVAEHLRGTGMRVDASQVLITTGSQQGLDLLGKVLVDAGSRVAVESPTYLGALQAFNVFEPQWISVPSDDEGPLPDGLASAEGARLLYALPNFQNPSGRCISASRREAVVEAAQTVGLPIVEDNPYGELWYDQPPPAPLAAYWPEGVVYLGSFSKVLAPGLRLGYVVAPPVLGLKLLQAKQAADLHTPGFNQRIVLEILRAGVLNQHLMAMRARYQARRDAMADALRLHMPEGCRWDAPRGGMFFWVELPAGVDAQTLLPLAVARGVAFVPGDAFYVGRGNPATMRLSFVTSTPDQIDRGVRMLADALRALL